MPLELALIGIRSAVYPDVQAPPLESIANFVASALPIYEYFPDSGELPRALRRRDLEGGLFRRNGRELHFIDGRAPKSALAFHVEDVQRVIAMLKQPDRTASVRSELLKARSRVLRERSRDIFLRGVALRSRSDVARGARHGGTGVPQ